MGAGRRLIPLALALAACTTHVPPPLPHAKGYVAGRPPVLVYLVREGDTLYAIGKRFGIPWRRIAERNHIGPPYHIVAGQRLVIDLRARAKPRHRRTKRTRIRLALEAHEGPEIHIRLSSQHRKAKRAHRPKRNPEIHARRPASPPRRAAHHTPTPELRAGHAPATRLPIRLIWPVKGIITSRFGRRHGRWHDGIDIAAPRGTPVHAAAAGVVIYADHRLTGYGNLIIIRHPHNIFTAYAHNERMLVRKGEHVRQGQVIATVGATGRATGPHLHFEVRIGPRPVDPLAYLPPR